MRKSRGARLKIQQKAPLTYSLTHANRRFFLDVNIPEGTQNVVLTGNRFVDFVGFKPVDSIETLNLDNNPILSFRGFPLMPNLRSLSMIGTPIAGLQNFRVQALACCGPKLRYINGSEVTSNEKSAAAAFGDQKLSHDFLIRGWIPKKPIAIQPDRGIDFSRTAGKKGAPQALPAKKRIEKIVASQDADPVSVRAVRVLRAQGNDTAQIRAFLRKHFAPTKEKDYTGKAATYKKKQETAVEVQIQHQQELINVMAAQLQALRTGNRTFNEYNEMVETAGKLLIENAEFLARLESGAPLEKTETVKVVKRDYELLRAAIVEFLDVDERTPDSELISALNEISVSDSVPEKRSSSSSDSSSTELPSQLTETSNAAGSLSSDKERGVELEPAAPEPDNEAKSSSSHKSHSSKSEDEKTESDQHDSDDKKSSDSSDSSHKEELSEGSSSDHEEKEQKQAEILSKDPTPVEVQVEKEAPPQEESSKEEVAVENSDDVQERETPGDDQPSSSRSSKKRKESNESAASESSSKHTKQSKESAASESSSKRRKNSTESAASESSSKKRKQLQDGDRSSGNGSTSEAAVSEKPDEEAPATKDVSDEQPSSSRSSRRSRKHSRESSASERSSKSKKHHSHSDDKHSHSSRSKSRQQSDEPEEAPKPEPIPEPAKEEQAKASSDTDNHSKASSKGKSSDDSDNFSPFKSETSSYFKSPKDKPSDSPKEEHPEEEKKVEIYPDNIPRSQRLPPPTSPMGRRGSPGRRRPTILHGLK